MEFPRGGGEVSSAKDAPNPHSRDEPFNKRGTVHTCFVRNQDPCKIAQRSRFNRMRSRRLYARKDTLDVKPTTSDTEDAVMFRMKWNVANQGFHPADGSRANAVPGVR